VAVIGKPFGKIEWWSERHFRLYRSVCRVDREGEGESSREDIISDKVDLADRLGLGLGVLLDRRAWTAESCDQLDLST